MPCFVRSDAAVRAPDEVRSLMGRRWKLFILHLVLSVCGRIVRTKFGFVAGQQTVKQPFVCRLKSGGKPKRKSFKTILSSRCFNSPCQFKLLQPSNLRISGKIFAPSYRGTNERKPLRGPLTRVSLAEVSWSYGDAQ